MRDDADSPLSPMRQTAIMLHEWFMSLRDAGFTEEQALSLIFHSMMVNRGDDDL